jgi:hypothetical protein
MPNVAQSPGRPAPTPPTDASAGRAPPRSRWAWEWTLPKNANHQSWTLFTPMSKLIYLLDDDGEATGKKKFINKSEVAVDVDTSE